MAEAPGFEKGKRHYYLTAEELGMDDDGNITATVVHRSDTLTNLLAVADAGDGEIGICTDTDSIVVYKDEGAGVVGTEYSRPDIIAAAEINMGSPVLTTGVDTPLTFGSVISDEFGIVDVTNNEIDIPELRNSASSHRGTTIQARFSGIMIASAATFIGLEIEYWNGSAWTKHANGRCRTLKPQINTAVGSPPFIHFDIELNTMLPSGPVPTDGRHRFVMFHDDAANISTVFTGGNVILKNSHRGTVKPV